MRFPELGASSASGKKGRGKRVEGAMKRPKKSKREEQEVHMCVLHHGLWGNPGHLAYLIGELKKAFPSLVIANVDVNQALR